VTLILQGMTDWDLISSYAGLLSLAAVSVYAGAFGTLPNSPRDKYKASEDDDDLVVERVSASDAWLFPIVSERTLTARCLGLRRGS
jgi:minor histocompatibility antigen H13